MRLLQEARQIVNAFPGLERFYTDGSKRGIITGSGIFSRLYTAGIRLPDNYSVMDAELHAISAALDFIITKNLHSVVFSDSQSALSAIHSGSSRHPLVASVCNRLINSDLRICMAWIPAHISLYGNEKADTWAKCALSYNAITLSPLSTLSFKHIVNNTLVEYWQAKLDRVHGFKIRLSVTPYDTASRPTRREEKVLCRLRTGVTVLTHIIPWVGRRPYDLCDDCYEQLTIKHILMDCITFHRQRQALKNHIINQGHRFTVFRILQDDQETIDLLFNYLKDTNLLHQL